MVAGNIFVDTTFLFDKTHKAFLGAEILKREAKDVTYAYGFLRDVLRIRQRLNLRKALFVVGESAYCVAPKENVESIVTLMTELGLPLLNEPKITPLDIACATEGKMTHILTHNKGFLQLAKGSLRVLLPNSSGEYIEVAAGDVKSYMGVAVSHVPTFLTLTQGPKAAQMTKRQAIRLIELHGNLDQLYDSLELIKSSLLRAKLADHKKRLHTIYTELQARRTKFRPELPSLTLKLDNQKMRKVLSAYGFHSLTRMLTLNGSDSATDAVTSVGTNGRKQLRDYRAVVDLAGLQELESVVLGADYCGVDTESDDKDPHRATLFGVSFSVKKGAAYFVSMLEKDLKGISPNDVAKSLRKLLDSDTKFIGHNIKYDYILLRRNNLRIKTVHFDTMLAAYDCYGDWEFFNLSYLAEKLLNRKIKSYKDVVGKDRTFLELPFSEIVQHACEDADVVLQLRAFLQKELETRVIAEQFFSETMRLLRDLGEFEYRGVKASSKRLEKIRECLTGDAMRLKESALKEIGTSVDLDSQKALELVVRETLNLKGVNGTKKINVAMLEQLAICNLPLQLVVKYRRAKKRLSAVEAIIKCVDENKVHPVFNQIRAREGRLSSKNPNLFQVESVSGLTDVFGKEIREHFRCQRRALDILQDAANDGVLRKDRAGSKRANAFLATHTVISELEVAEWDELLLNLLLGHSNFEVSKRFFIDQMSASTIRHDVEVRYRKSFQFLDEFRQVAAKQGYACKDGKRKYLAGLRSSNLGKRQKAQEYAVRWLLGC
jgi:DNA polymerase I-like protein with 3'-5' exonuclease and polymerase domains